MKNNETLIEWTQDKPKFAEYYWAIYKNRDDLLDESPEIVKVYFDGKWSVFRPGMKEKFKVEDFEFWSTDYIRMPKDIILFC